MKSTQWMTLIALAGVAPLACSAQNSGSEVAKPVLAANLAAPTVDGPPPAKVATPDGVASTSAPTGPQGTVTVPQSEFDIMKARIAHLETAQAAQPAAAAPGKELGAEKSTKTAPFSEDDWTWLNANGRVVDFPLSTKYFTPEFRADVNYIFDFNHPADDTMGGSTEQFRSQEFQVEQLSFGGDIRIDNVRGRFLTMFGEFATTTPRNDASYSRGQWDLADAYRYVSEAWGGYHWDKAHGINLDAGIFVSYIGLFSYYNADNWTYQPSYVSSNTPWFFTGLRGQYFPTAKLKIEPWLINGWQTYGRYNGKPGLGGQILWRPKPWVDVVLNNYGLGEDALGVPYRHRYHTDDSIQIKYYDNKSHYFDKAAMTFTADAGCEVGVGTNPVDAGTNVSCHGDQKAPASAGGGTAYKQYFIGYMLYNRVWWDKDKYAFTLGGGQMSNPGRYLTLLPPINGATATSGTPYFTENPGDPYTAWDMTGTYDYMPSQYITFRAELGYRHASVPYWTGRGGITPPGGNNGAPANYVCSSTSALGGGANSGVGFGGGLAAAEAACGGLTGAKSVQNVWFPDLRRGQATATVAIMVRF
jgi:hypothetical protein